MQHVGRTLQHDASVRQHVGVAGHPQRERAFCSTSNTLVPDSRLMRWMIPKISWTTSGAKPKEGSSSMIKRGRAISARPIASICCSPPDR